LPRNRHVRPGATPRTCARPSSGDERAAPREAAQVRVRPFDPFADVSP